jgi:hypothetical protein
MVFCEKISSDARSFKSLLPSGFPVVRFLIKECRKFFLPSLSFAVDGLSMNAVAVKGPAADATDSLQP